MKKHILLLTISLSAIGMQAQVFKEIFHESEYYITQNSILETRDGNLILNCPLLDSAGVHDIGYYLYKVTLEGEFVDSLFIASTCWYRDLLELNPFDDNSNIMVSTTRDETTGAFQLKIRYIDDDLNILDEKTVRFDDATPSPGNESLFLDINNDIILHYIVGDKMFLARVGVDGTLKDNVMFHEAPSGKSGGWRHHHIDTYNVSPLEYCIWYCEQSRLNIMVVDTNFNLISHRALDVSYRGGMGEQVAYCDEDHYMLSSVFQYKVGGNWLYDVVVAKFTKDDELVKQTIFYAPDYHLHPWPSRLARGKKGGWYYSYQTKFSGEQVSISKVDDNMNVVWERYCLSANQVYHRPYSMRVLENGGVAVGGWDSSSSPDDFRIFLIIVTDDGWTTPEMEAYVKPYCIYPNPTKDFVTLQVSPDTQFVKAELYDASGRLLLTAESDVTQIGISHLPQGQYVLKLYDTNGKTWSDKVVKE